MVCKIHTGTHGGKYRMHRKKGGGTKRVYIKKRMLREDLYSRSRLKHGRKHKNKK